MKATLEAVLREGESLTPCIENAVCREAQVGSEQNAAVERATRALQEADEGPGRIPSEEVLVGSTRRATEAQQRIREAVTARNRLAGR